MASDKISEIFDPNTPFEERFREEEIDVEVEKENTREAFKRIKKEMRRLGFTSFDDYCNYLEYMEKSNKKKSQQEM